MKHLNNSEGTFASTKFYFMEGSKAQALFSKTSRHTYITSHQQNTLTSWNCFPVSFLKLLWVVPQTSAVTIWHRIQWCCSGHPSQKKTPEASYWVTQSTTLRITWGEQNLRTVRHLHLLHKLIHKLLNFVEYNNSTGITSTGCSTAHASSSLNFLFVSYFVYSSQFSWS